MRLTIITFCISTLIALHVSPAQSTDWDILWENLPPVGNPSHPNAWMDGTATYTGIAYDAQNDVLYVVNPGVCQAGLATYPCPAVHIWDASTGSVAVNIGNNGVLNTDTTIIRGGFENGKFGLFKIDVDDAGRIFACNVVAPIWTDMGAFKIYRWKDAGAVPELVYETIGTGPGNSEMIHAVWGTSFDVVGAPHGTTPADDSVRIFVSGGDIPGYVNDQINVFAADTRAGAATAYRLALIMPYSQTGVNYAGSGIAATGSYLTSPVLASMSTFATALVNQRQSAGSPVPQTYTATPHLSVPNAVTGPGGPLRYIAATQSNYAYGIIADQQPQLGSTKPNLNTSARVVSFASLPPTLWPPTETPSLGSDNLDDPIGNTNYISDVDYKIYIDPQTDMQYLQLFVLMSNNGIASYRTKSALPVPVELEAFTAVTQGNTIELIWQVAYESNNHGFEVFRSFDNGTRWESIGFVAGKGTSSSMSEYTFDDNITESHRYAGTVQYRLKQIDTDGTFTWSPIAEAYIAPESAGITLMQNYPNPVHPSTTITFGLDQPSYVTLTVYSLLGEKVATLAGSEQSAGIHHVAFNTASLAPGVYIYRLEANGTTLERQMTVTR